MAIYRKSFWKSQTTPHFFFLIIPMAIGVVFYINFIIGIIIKSITEHVIPLNNAFAFLLITAITLMVIAIIVLKLMDYSYLIVGNSKIQLKCIFFPFLNREYNYSEIEGCILGNYNNIYPDYFQLKINGKWTRRLRWKISLVDRKDYPSLIAELNSKGVEVFKKGIK